MRASIGRKLRVFIGSLLVGLRCFSPSFALFHVLVLFLVGQQLRSVFRGLCNLTMASFS